MKNSKLNDKIFEAMLEAACEEVLDNKISEWEEMEDNNAPFSRDFEKRMKETIQKSSHKVRMQKIKKVSLKVAASIIIIIMLGLTATMSVSAFRYNIFNTAIEIGEKYFGFSFTEADKQETDDIDLNDVHLPDGVTKSIVTERDDMSVILIKDNNGDEIWLRVMDKDAGTKFTIDSEHVKVPYHIDINNTDVSVYEGNNDNYSYFVWETDERFYALFGKVDIEELRAILKAILGPKKK